MTKPNDKKEEEHDITAMLAVITDCIQKNKLELLASIICKLQREYTEICELATDGEYQPTWSHKHVLDYITYYQRY